jgi:cell division septal protein FtsQ
MKTKVSIIQKKKTRRKKKMSEKKMAILMFLILVVILVVGIFTLRDRGNTPIPVETVNVAENSGERVSGERNEGIIVIESGEIIIGGN